MDLYPGPEVERLRALKDLAWQATVPVDATSLLLEGLRIAIKTTQAVAGCVRIVDGEEQLSITGSQGVDHNYLATRQRLSPQLPILKSTLASDEPRIVPVEGGNRSVTGLRADLSQGVAALIPLFSAGTAQGLIVLVYHPEATPPPLVQDWFSVLGALLGTALVNGRAYEQLESASRTDALTGLCTRPYFEDHLRRELARSRRTGTPMSVALLDVDELKQINDRWGHVTGDEVLRTVGDVLRGVRASDISARFGGDEFIILMPDTDYTNAEVVVRRLRSRLMALNEAGRFPFALRVSIGVRQVTSPEQDVIAEADAAMYAEKRRRTVRQPSTDPDNEEMFECEPND